VRERERVQLSMCVCVVSRVRGAEKKSEKRTAVDGREISRILKATVWCRGRSEI
jgi:hypothetical protein